MQKDVTISRRIVTVLLKMILLKIILLKKKKRRPDVLTVLSLYGKISLLYKMPLALRHAAKAVAVKPRKIMVANM